MGRTPLLPRTRAARLNVAGLPTAFRVAGAIAGLGLIAGLSPGAIPALVGAIAMITVARSGDPRSIAGLIVIGCALGVGGLRWTTLDLGSIYGIQEVLGPAVAVGPPLAGAAAATVVVAALLALVVWSAAPPAALLALPGVPGIWLERAWTWVETAVPLAAITSVFLRLPEPAVAVVAPLLLAPVVSGAGSRLRRVKTGVLWGVLTGAGALLVVAAALALESR